MAHAFDARMCVATGDLRAVVSREDVKACGGGSCGGGWPATAWGVAARQGYMQEDCWQYKTVNESPKTARTESTSRNCVTYSRT